jgi:hypothetical protein
VSADERVVRVLAEHHEGGCSCGWKLTMKDFGRWSEAHRAHVAAALGPVLAEVRAEALRDAADDLFAKAVTLRKHADACDADGLPSSAMADRLHASRIADFGDWLLDRIGGTP